MLVIDDKYYFRYSNIGEFRCDGNWIHPKRSIDSYELILVIEGIVHIKEDDVEYEIKPNECIILEPHKVHGGTKISGCPTAFYWFHFYTNMPMPFKENKYGELHEVKYLLKKLLHISNTPSYNDGAKEAVGLNVFYELGNNNLLGNSLVNRIAEYIRINKKDATVAKTSEYFGYNADYVGKLFKKHFGTTMKQYINSQKISYAKDLLLTTDLSIKEISARMNFSEENLFIKFFMYHEQISPARFRNKYYNTHMNNK